jgi:hypothetical protein
VTLPSDPLEALNWAWDHSGHAWWLVVAVAAAVGWVNKRLRDWNRRNAPVTAPPRKAAAKAVPAAAPAAASASTAYAAAPSYAAAGYVAQPAYAAPPAAPKPHAPSRKVHREAAPAQQQRAVTPAARSVDVPAPAASGRWTLAGAFGDPAHARTAIVVAEVLGPPVGLR